MLWKHEFCLFYLKQLCFPDRPKRSCKERLGDLCIFLHDSATPFLVLFVSPPPPTHTLQIRCRPYYPNLYYIIRQSRLSKELCLQMLCCIYQN